MAKKKDIKEILLKIEQLYFIEALTITEISLELGLTEIAIRKAINEIDKKRNIIKKENAKNNEKIKALKRNAIKNLGFIEDLDLEGETLLKLNYSNDWTKVSGEVVKNSIKGQMALGYARSLVYTNQLDELADIILWEKEELKKIRNDYRDGTISATEMTLRTKAVNTMTKTQLYSIGVKSDKAVADFIDKVGNLTVAEERVKIEKTKVFVDESGEENDIRLLDKLVLGDSNFEEQNEV